MIRNHCRPSLIPAIRAVALVAVALGAGCGGSGDESTTDVDGVDHRDDVHVAQRLDPSGAPADNFDLTHWKLTLPSGDEVSARELAQGFSAHGIFYTDPDSGGLVLYCQNRAGTTANSSYSRTELREMRQPQGPASADDNNWTSTLGGSLQASLSVDAVSTSGDPEKLGRVVIGQIHGPDSEVIRLYFRKLPDESRGRVYAGLDSFDNVNRYSDDIVGNQGDAGIALGERFDYRISLLGTRLRVDIEQSDGRHQSLIEDIDPRYLGENLYFKAGVYNQNNTGHVNDGVRATFFALSVTHP